MIWGAFAILTALIGAALWIAHRARQDGAVEEVAKSQAETLQAFEKAAAIDAEIRSLPDNVIRDRLRRWTR